MAAFVLGFAGVGLTTRHRQPPVVVGTLTQTDIVEIQRAISRVRVGRIRSAIRCREFQYLVHTCLRDLATGQTREIGTMQATISADGAARPAAYALTGYGTRSRVAFKYELARMTNGWRVILSSYRYD